MFRSSAITLCCLLGASLAGTSGFQAQTSEATADSSNTYVTPDGYGLGQILPGAITDVTARTRAVMIKMKIVEERSRSLGQGWKELRGKRGAMDVSIRLKSQSASTTRVEVTARRGLADYNQGLQRQVLDAIGKI
ncbi:MAG: hypothetical protein ACREL3_02425 [Gemmatimonadales bacterium]